MRFAKIIILIGVLAGAALADYGLSYLTIDGITYHDVKFGPANQRKVLIRHGKGVVYIPIEKIPPQLGPYIFGYDKEMAARGNKPPTESPPKTNPSPKPPEIVSQPPPRVEPSTPTVVPPPPSIPALDQVERQAYERDRARLVLLGGKLVEKSKLTVLTGFVRDRGVEVIENGKTYRGTTIDLARKKAGLPPVAPQLELRPGLWERTGDVVLLIDCAPNVEEGELVRVYGTEVTAVQNRRAFVANGELTFEQWKHQRGK